MTRACAYGEREVECGALSGGAFGPRFAPMSLDNPTHVGQSHARTREFVVSHEPLEGKKELPGVSHVKPDPLILHEERSFAILTHADRSPFRRKLASVLHQVQQNELNEERIAEAHHVGFDLELAEFQRSAPGTQIARNRFSD